MTHGEILRAGGAVPLRDGKFVFSVEAFKRAFKVGDLIRHGYNVTGRITAIGEKRFLYKVSRHNGDFDERVGTIKSMTGWGRVEA